MTIGLVFLTVLMAVIVGWLFRQTLDVQPWLAPAAGHEVGGDAPGRPAIKTSRASQ